MTADRRRAALAAAVHAVVDSLTAAELIHAVTPERIGQELGYSSSSVRYQFGLLFGGADDPVASPSKWTFDRDHLWRAILNDIEARVLATTVTIRDTYLAAINDAAAHGRPTAFVNAVRADLDAYAPGASVAPTDLSERSYLMAVAAADASPWIGHRLCAIRDAELALYVPIYERSFVLTGRRPASGESASTIARTIAHLIEGASLERRHSPATPGKDRSTARAMVGIYRGLTVPDPGADGAPLANLDRITR